MDYQENRISSEEIFEDIERRIKNNFFKSKEELTKYIFYLKENGFLNQDELEQKMPELLGKYDELNQTSDMPLNMENYKGVGLENQNLIVGTEQERILKTLESKDDLNKEFKQVQNEIVANNQDALTNADVIFNHMADNQKEELSLISLSEAITKDNLDIELLEKLKFFVSNKYINPYSYKTDIENGIFYNTETSEVLEVRKDEATNKYQIYKGSEIVYGDELEESNEMKLNNDIPEEEKSYEDKSKNKPKIRVLRPPSMNDYNNAAFSKMNFLLLVISMFIASIVFINILNKFVK